MPILVDKISPSLINTFTKCQIAYFCNYFLGYKEKDKAKTTAGSAAHEVLEAVAMWKMVEQGDIESREHSTLGTIDKNLRIKEWTETCIAHYKEKCKDSEPWTEEHEQIAHTAIDTVLEHPVLSPLKLNIISPEQYFYVEIPYEWAIFRDENGKPEFVYDKKLGHTKPKRLVIRGLIDLVFRDSDGVLNYLDYKTGKVVDWNKGGKAKVDIVTNADKESNWRDCIQVCTYYWVMRQKYPNERLITNLWYTNNDVIFDDEFDKSHEQYAMKVIESIFSEMKETDYPEPTYSYRSGGRCWGHCLWCDYRKKTFADWDLPHLDIAHKDERDYHANIDGKASVCDALNLFGRFRTVDQTVAACKNIKKNRNKSEHLNKYVFYRHYKNGKKIKKPLHSINAETLDDAKAEFFELINENPPKTNIFSVEYNNQVLEEKLENPNGK